MVIQMIKFTSIESAEIFTRDFRTFAVNNVIEFPKNEPIVAIYGPNGTGKTSFIKVLSGEKGTKIKFEYDGKEYSANNEIFHIINDQNNRNVIMGETKDFFVGDNIRREFELQEQISCARIQLIGDIVSKLKADFGISAASSPMIGFISSNETVANLIKDLVNSKSRGSKFATEEIINAIKSISPTELILTDDMLKKNLFLINDYSKKNFIIQRIEQLKDVVPSNPKVYEIEENSEAIRILDRFHKNQCIVCDTDNIDWMALLKRKESNCQTVISSFDEHTQKLIREIIDLVFDSDPFSIKAKLFDAISKGDNSIINSLLGEFATAKETYEKVLLNELLQIVSKSSLPDMLEEYQKLLSEKPDITDEDMIFVEEIISNSMGKSLSLSRDGNKNLKIKLSENEFLGIDRGELPLSSGEQNFLSLTFEFLKAKNSSHPIVVIDDPISSFDSIYKNKIVYAIVKMLHEKKRLILTHNTDLLRLLDGQYKHCYKLYLLNNTDGEENGFISLNSAEQEMLISLEKLLNTFRTTIFSHIKDVKLFLIAMLPFMRGYANLINNVELFNSLTKVMHGYKIEKVDIAQAYITLFGNQQGTIPENYEISVDDILHTTVDGVEIVNRKKYPLLDRTLHHSFTYLFLRLLVEKRLVENFSIDVKKHSQLGQIICAAYPDEKDIVQIRKRIRLTSKKTLLNEFNHFEGNLSIFQPAIDITDHSLGKEKTDILSFVDKP